MTLDFHEAAHAPKLFHSLMHKELLMYSAAVFKSIFIQGDTPLSVVFKYVFSQGDTPLSVVLKYVFSQGDTFIIDKLVNVD